MPALMGQYGVVVSNGEPAAVAAMDENRGGVAGECPDGREDGGDGDN